MIKRSYPWLLAAALVLALRAITPVAAPINDAHEYLNVATFGLGSESHLSAPFAYRPAVPLFVWLLSQLTSAPALALFPWVTLAATFVLLLAAYYLALLAGGSKQLALVIMLVLAASLFVVRFPLYCPLLIDVEAVALVFAAFACLLRRRYVGALLLSLAGLFFKEFLLVPLFAMAGVLLLQYVHERQTRPLALATLTVVAALIVFLLPRLLIPVEAGYGANFRYRPPEPSQTLYFSQLRSFLAWPPKVGIAVNLLLALVSFWLPALMLSNMERLRNLWQALDANRPLVIFWTLAVLLLASFGGTNIMIFVVYTAPVLVLVLVLLSGMEMHWSELAFMVLGTLMFNRILFPFGVAGGDPGDSIAFYGAYWHLLNTTTVWRFGEAGAWIACGQLVRVIGKSYRTQEHKER